MGCRGTDSAAELLDSSLGSTSTQLVIPGKLLNLSGLSFFLFELDNLISHFMLNSEVSKVKTFHYQGLRF